MGASWESLQLTVYGSKFVEKRKKERFLAALGMTSLPWLYNEGKDKKYVGVGAGGPTLCKDREGWGTLTGS
jgi:hypothetical protein